MNILHQLLQKESFRLVFVFIVGISIGVVFYPSSRIEERLTKKHLEEISSIKENHSKETQLLNEKLSVSLKENKELHQQSELRISKLTQEIKTLQSKQKTSYFKLIKPDGTIEIKKFTESEVNESSKVVSSIQQEFKTKIDSIESKWSLIHKERIEKIQKDFDSKESQYKKTIDELQHTKITSTNSKRFSLEGGIMNNKDYYGHASMDIWGPTFIGIHGETGVNNLLGIGIGLRF